MAVFPKKELEIRALAASLAEGLRNNVDLYPSPPNTPEEIEDLIAEFDASRETTIAQQALAKAMVAKKNGDLEQLAAMARSAINYAENTVGNDDIKLNLIGWGGRNLRAAPKVPGQPRTLTAERILSGVVALRWKEPNDGGKVVHYRIVRDGRSEEVAIDREIILQDQPVREEVAYQVVAQNSVGSSLPSNQVIVVL